VPYFLGLADFLPHSQEDISHWSLVAGLVGAALGLALWRPMQSVFLDQICLHQTNLTLKFEGLTALAAIVRRCENFVVCWDMTYMRRAWCVFELAAFLTKPEAEKNLMILPVGWGPCVLWCFLGLWSLQMWAYLILAWHRQHPDIPIWVWQAIDYGLMVPVSTFLALAVAAFRRHFRSIETVQKQLLNFALQDTSCTCCDWNHRYPKTGAEMPCDRGLLEDCIRVWFGSTQEFEEVVRTRVYEAFASKMGRYNIPYLWIVGPTVPILWAYGTKIIQLCAEQQYNIALQQACFIVGWCLEAIPLIVMISLAYVHRLRAQRSMCGELMLNVGGSLFITILYVLFSLPLFVARTLLAQPWGDVVWCSAMIPPLLVSLHFGRIKSFCQGGLSTPGATENPFPHGFGEVDGLGSPKGRVISL